MHQKSLDFTVAHPHNLNCAVQQMKCSGGGPGQHKRPDAAPRTKCSEAGLDHIQPRSNVKEDPFRVLENSTGKDPPCTTQLNNLLKSTRLAMTAQSSWRRFHLKSPSA